MNAIVKKHKATFRSLIITFLAESTYPFAQHEDHRTRELN